MNPETTGSVSRDYVRFRAHVSELPSYPVARIVKLHAHLFENRRAQLYTILMMDVSFCWSDVCKVYTSKR